MESVTIAGTSKKEYTGNGLRSRPINKTPLPPYLTLYTRKILLNLVRDVYPRTAAREVEEERKKERKK